MKISARNITGFFGGIIKMSVLEIVCGVLMLITSVLLVIVTVMQPPKQQNMSSAI